MGQQIKSNNKNNSKDVTLPLKLAFQANIFKYVEKKKRELSIFAALKQNQSNQKDKHSSTASNLIKQTTAFNFCQPIQKNIINSEMLLSSRIKLIELKSSQKGSILKKKVKGHKSTLSDWRMLYDEREGIAEKHEFKNKSPDKMAVTDRLFYPIKKESHSMMEKSCQRHNDKEHRRKQEINSNKNEKFFVSDENFFHMYHRSVTPIASDHSQKKRIAKYLKENKDRRESRHGMRLMNEGIFSELSKNDVAFVPYKFQSSGGKSKLYPGFEQSLSYQIVRNTKFQSNRADSVADSKHLNNFEDLSQWNRTQIKKFNQISKPSDQEHFQEDKQKYSEEQNPQFVHLKPSKEGSQKNHINLSQLFVRLKHIQQSKREEIVSMRLRLFKTRLNKIEKAISNTKKTQSENKFANFEYSVQLPQSRKSSLNTTKQAKRKWIK